MLTTNGPDAPEASPPEDAAHLSRRDLMSVGSGLLAAAAVPRSFGQESSSRLIGLDALRYASVAALADGMQRREFTSEEIVTACIERIREVNPVLNAVVQSADRSALARAREADAARARGESWGPLHGVPMTIKDSLDTAGVISTGGTVGRAAFVPARDATVVARLLGAGAILLGKTNTPEFTLSFETDNLVYGRTNNPYDVQRTPGGSSGGGAAIVAAGGSPFDIGSDYAGSIRVPAHFCGIAGIKPTAGRVPRTGHAFPFGGIQDSYQQIGPLARHVDDLALLLPLIAGPDWVDPGVAAQPLGDHRRVDLRALRIAFHTDNAVMTPDEDIVLTVQAAARHLESHVLAVEEARPSGVERGFELGFALASWDGGSAVRRLLQAAGTEQHTLQRFVDGPSTEPSRLEPLIADWYEWRSRMLSFMQGWDAILCPVNARCAPPHGFTLHPESLPAFSYTVTYNAVGWPAAVVRAGTSREGLPIGVQIVAAPGREDVALALAKVIESGIGGFEPPAI